MAEGCCKIVLAGHTEDVVDAALSIEKSSVVTASYDGTARVWDLVTGECTALLTGHARDVHGVEMSPDGGIVVTLAGQEAKVWETESGGQPPPPPPLSLSLSLFLPPFPFPPSLLGARIHETALLVYH